MHKPLLVVALGGNALLRRGEPLEADVQRRNIEQAADAIAALTTQWRVVLVHGNGPQVGLLALQNSACNASAPWPLDILVAETQGMIGYLLQQALQNRLPEQQISMLLTQVEIAADDPAFRNPTKYIGPVYSAEQAGKLAKEQGWTMKADGEYVRRVVPSPLPVAIVEHDAILALSARGHLVICNGGGGIPVIRDQQGQRHGAEAVIDKDLASALLATQLSADALLILTDADAVYLNWGTPDSRALHHATPDELLNMAFDAGSMGPKIAAVCEFVTQGTGIAGIGSLTDAADILRGHKGTLIATNPIK
ncbi:carbamate kinase [Erwinia psidii]|uniref:Carbamate kinase n=1 Tax=Erwinia psidii TaxID=69224 RepID=A0A3N6RWG5_9GAMM|nr:carbamate kinase [Erwinia psidii]MCX8958502.1 carbamate kinase [Erwinia psidii]MCX8962005.1 carbamate kinase [Erwinia psidii]MCX8965665.1 carbamate kinase [Erwinia psidii]RQM37398.1 carbamate kinase [Erwinia psidii]